MGRKSKVKGSIINNEIIKYKDEIICQNSQSKYTNLQQKKVPNIYKDHPRILSFYNVNST